MYESISVKVNMSFTSQRRKKVRRRRTASPARRLWTGAADADGAGQSAAADGHAAGPRVDYDGSFAVTHGAPEMVPPGGLHHPAGNIDADAATPGIQLQLCPEVARDLQRDAAGTRVHDQPVDVREHAEAYGAAAGVALDVRCAESLDPDAAGTRVHLQLGDRDIAPRHTARTRVGGQQVAADVLQADRTRAPCPP